MLLSGVYWKLRGKKSPKREGGEMQRLTIPKRVQLPFGYVVTIKQVTDSEMEEIVEDGTGESVDGYWDPDERVLYIRKSLPIRRRRYILAHELGGLAGTFGCIKRARQDPS